MHHYPFNLLLSVLIMCPFFLHAENKWIQTSGPEGGEVYCFAHHGAIVYAGTFRNGVFRSDDNGLHWVESNSGIEECEINGLLTCSDSVFAASNDGLFLSVDSGKTWMSAACDFNDRAVSALCSVDGTMLVATGDGAVFRTADGGVTWEKMELQFGDDHIERFTVHSDTVYASVMFLEGIYSPDKGTTWFFVDSTEMDPYAADYAFAGDTLFIGDMSDGVLISVAGGPVVSIGLADSNITAMEIVGGTVYAGTKWGGVFRSEDGGRNWVATNDGLYGKFIYCLKRIGTTLFAGTRGGVYTLGDDETVWIARNDGLRNARISSLCFYNTTLVAGTFNCGVFYSNDCGTNWEELRSGLPERAVADLHAAAVGVIYAGLFREGFYTLSDFNSMWEMHTDGLPSSITSITMLVHGGGYLFAAADNDGVLRFDGETQVWTDISGDDIKGNVMSVYATENQLFAGTRVGTICRSDDWGEQWDSITPHDIDGMCLQFAHMESLLFAATDSGIFRSDDRGENWERTGADFSQHAIVSLLVDGNLIFAGSDDNGVYVSADSGDSWYAYNSGLTGRYVPALMQRGDTLFAGLNSGIWYRALSDINEVTGIDYGHVLQTDASQGIRLNRIDRSTMLLTLHPHTSPVTVCVYTMAGRIAQVLMNRVTVAGAQTVRWDTSELSAGTYLVRMSDSHTTNIRTVCLF